MSLIITGVKKTATTPTTVIPANLVPLQNDDVKSPTKIKPPHATVEIKRNDDHFDLKLRDDISEEILDFFTDDTETAKQAPQLPAAMHGQYSADLDSLMEQIQLDTDEELLQYLSGQLDLTIAKKIFIELLDPTPDESAQLLQERYQVLCDLLGLETTPLNVMTAAISMENALKKITFHTFQSKPENRNYFWKLLQRLTSH